jgi:hypothetical protein
MPVVRGLGSQVASGAPFVLQSIDCRANLCYQSARGGIYLTLPERIPPGFDPPRWWIPKPGQKKHQQIARGIQKPTQVVDIAKTLKPEKCVYPPPSQNILGGGVEPSTEETHTLGIHHPDTFEPQLVVDTRKHTKNPRNGLMGCRKTGGGYT